MKIARSIAGPLMLLTLAACRADMDDGTTTDDRTPPSAPAQQRPATPNPQPAPTPAASATRWRCGEILLTAGYRGEKADLSFSGRDLSLPIARSGSGARYADDKGNEFWSKGDQATLTLVGEEKRDCEVTEHISPWEEAKIRGIVFRAVGQEPGWWVEVGSGDSPPLHAELDYGQRKIHVAHSMGISSTPGYGGKTDDGITVVLRTKAESCSDAMSGERFDSSAELTVGDELYKGCGAYLQR